MGKKVLSSGVVRLMNELNLPSPPKRFGAYWKLQPWSVFSHRLSTTKNVEEFKTTKSSECEVEDVEKLNTDSQPWDEKCWNKWNWIARFLLTALELCGKTNADLAKFQLQRSLQREGPVYCVDPHLHSYLQEVLLVQAIIVGEIRGLGNGF